MDPRRTSPLQSPFQSQSINIITTPPRALQKSQVTRDAVYSGQGEEDRAGQPWFSSASPNRNPFSPIQHMLFSPDPCEKMKTMSPVHAPEALFDDTFNLTDLGLAQSPINNANDGNDSLLARHPSPKSMHLWSPSGRQIASLLKGMPSQNATINEEASLNTSAEIVTQDPSIEAPPRSASALNNTTYLYEYALKLRETPGLGNSADLIQFLEPAANQGNEESSSNHPGSHAMPSDDPYDPEYNRDPERADTPAHKRRRLEFGSEP